MKQKRYLAEFVNRQTHERRSYVVYAFNALDADIEGYKKLAAQEGDDWRKAWWPVGAHAEGRL